MNILITGASGGIGQAMAEKFLTMGHTVFGMDIAPATVQYPAYTHLQMDILTHPLPSLPAMEIVINNAGVQDSGQDIEVNLKGTIRITEAYALQNSIRSVLFIASASAQTGAEFPEYAASKGGMVAYMKNVALRVAAFGATANSLSPGGVLTPLNHHVMHSPDLWAQIMQETLLPKWATPEEIAEWAYFVTVINRSMTAQDILIDNGEAAKSHFVW